MVKVKGNVTTSAFSKHDHYCKQSEIIMAPNNHDDDVDD